MQSVRSRLSAVKAHDFTITSVEPHRKDGGVFVNFKFTASDTDDALRTIEHELQQKIKQEGALPSWLGTQAGNVWLVKGTPWIEVRSSPCVNLMPTYLPFRIWIYIHPPF